MTTPHPTGHTTLLSREHRVMHRFMTIAVLVMATGFITYFWPGSTPAHQWTNLLHVFMGCLFAIYVIPYLVLHISRTIGVRKPLVVFSGTLAVLAVLSVIATGAHMAWLGQREALRWIYGSHVYLAYGFVGITLAHVVGLVWISHLATGRFRPSWKTLDRRTAGRVLAGLAVASTVVTIAAWGYTAVPVENEASVVTPYAYDYGDHPFRPSQTETTIKTHFVKPRQIAASDDCGVCHQEIYEQWQASMHGRAASDPAYVRNVTLLAEKKGITATRYCEGCHAPIALLTGELTPGGKHGGIAGTPGNIEGVSCRTCHQTSRAIHIKGVASYEFDPGQDYLFAQSDNRWLQRLRHFLIRINPKPHRLEMARPFLPTPELCATCHAQFMDKEINNWAWVKMQDDYSAWLKGPFSGQGEHTFANAQIMTCRDCHFPLVPGRDPSANRDGMLRSHRALGANTAVPAVVGDPVQLQATTDFLQSNRLNVAIEPPTRGDARQSALLVPDKAPRTDGETPSYFYLGETAKLRITVANTGVGHDFPGGTIDINEAWLMVRITDAENRTVFERGALGAEGHVDEDAHFYRTTALDRRGNEVWRHDLFNMVGERNRNVIPAGRSDIIEYTFQVPTWAKGPLTVVATLRYRKLNQRYAAWAFQKKDIVLPITDMARDQTQIALRDRAPTVVGMQEE